MRFAIRGVIYDLDDLMVNSYPLHMEAMLKIFEKYGKDMGNLPSQMVKNMVGRRIKDILTDLIGFFELDVDFEKFSKERSDIFLALVKSKIKPMPGLLKSLRLFTENNFKIALGSSGTKKYINIVLKKFSIKDYFNVIVTGDDVKNGKPNPETYLVSAQKLGLKPQNTLVLEDATNGIESAKVAGCWCIAVKNKNTPPQDLSRADIIVKSLEEIDLDLINSL
ncbi:hypothetical protein A2165_02420 [Candidatus Curtissbacteria bacterium RBG_13_40_7]|uniref:Phosphatase n=1 Tax=Candidatus Curtissbacteria bacterium RBG_13_40_7 TaxID=1797706 RepID=A0A1F5FY94_9BACT|nr:MAG: hypothetical protein A2165_02420 [Candidatus Curtissbacteria bacterium RBG_13_40_7]